MEYPVAFEADYIEHRSRLTSFFRALLAIPVLLWVAIYGIAAFFVWIAAWFAIVFTGRYPAGMYRFLARLWNEDLPLSERITAAREDGIDKPMLM